MGFSNQRGFSLVELMVCVAIVGILSAIATQNLDTFTAKARISRVASELAGLKTVIESLKAANGHYPGSPGWSSALPFGTEYQVDCTSVTTGYGPENDQGYRELCAQMSAFNPSSNGMPQRNAYCGEPKNYLYSSDGQNYQLMAYCFDRSELSALAKKSRCAGSICWGLSFFSPGGEVW